MTAVPRKVKEDMLDTFPENREDYPTVASLREFWDTNLVTQSPFCDYFMKDILGMETTCEGCPLKSPRIIGPCYSKEYRKLDSLFQKFDDDQLDIDLIWDNIETMRHLVEATPIFEDES